MNDAPSSDSKRYVIGDLQGCFDSLELLLSEVGFREGHDYVYLLGDIINRGPQSLDCLRWAAHTPNVTSVLGNHDLHLLAVATGNERYHKTSDTLIPILQAPDRAVLLDWLRHRPLLIRLNDVNTTLVHAGIVPQWSLAHAQYMANAIEQRLQADDWQAFVHQHLYGNEPAHESEADSEIAQLRYAINNFARMRLCQADGRLEFKHKLSPDQAPAGYAPWFSWPRRDDSCGRILFGHWSTLSQDTHLAPHPNAVCLDSGCLWGKALTALCLETNEFTSIDCPQYAKPGKV
ncbi:MAG: bis(5'-nucleosyl)-tetraphosphatase (symmetrical) [Thiotrichales bacterium 16-46-22]|nr:symmetrical bis(5'-nucleosyl)-tetraphosphatase [Gammaproteobacteria bacterium]OYZ05386.1 MAG: bis(5'-nucleosyl)-tetraphosphatase (symmetrical) [Thiotrichales bacterium 16-46-22]